MAENNENPEVPAEPREDADQAPTAAQPATDEVAENGAVPPAAPAPVQVRLRDRAWSFRAMLAVAVATLLIGGAGGAAIVAATDDGHDRHPRFSRFVDGPGRHGGPGGLGGGWRDGDGRQFRGPGRFGPDGPQLRNGPQQVDPEQGSPGSTPPNGPQSSQPTPTPRSGSSS